MRFAIRTVIGLALSSLSAALFTLAFPPYDLWPLVGVGFVPALLAQHRVMPRRIGGLAYGVALGGFFWGYFGPMFAGTVWFMEWLPLIVGVIATLLSNGDRSFHERTGYRLFVLEGAVVWVGIEAIRGFAPVVGTGGFVAYALYSQPWLLQPVGLFSIYGLSLLIMLVNYALTLGALALLDRRLRLDTPVRPIAGRLAGRWVGAMLAVLLAWVGLSVALLGQATVPGIGVRVAAVQPDGSPDMATHLGKLTDQTRQAAAQGAQLVVWPEGALSFDPQVSYTAQLRALTRETGVYLALGYGVRMGAGLRNEAVVLTPDGQFLGPYGKDHPVVWLGETSLSGGTYPTYQTPLGTLGTIICYDLNFTDTARKTAANGAQIIAVGSNDWPALAVKQYTNLVLRAVENRVTLIKADGRYDSAVIDPTGRIVALAVTPDGGQATLVTDVPIGRANAPLIGLGDWLGWLCIAGTALFAGLGMVSGRRAGKAQPSEGLPGTPLPEAPAGA
jgi:apolipoprotein N-acyltransferase